MSVFDHFDKRFILTCSRLVPQLTSVSHLLISEAGLRKLLVHTCAFPPILDMVRAFGRMTGEEERSGSPFVDRSDTAEGITGEFQSIPSKAVN